MEILISRNIDAEKIVQELDSVGASACLILPEDFRQQLVVETSTYQFKKREEVIRQGQPTEVRQQLSSFRNFPLESLYLRLEEELQQELNNQFSLLDNYPFTTPLSWNRRVLQRHENSSIGITPHVDGRENINLIGILNVSGKADFYTCDDREGSNAKRIEATPGTLVLMKARGFRNYEGQQFHWVNNIRGTRYTYGLRQKEIK